jgi:excisionase family DNA binding protein
MAKKLIDLEEAAKMLGVSPEVLVEMRSRQEISAYRDGSTWKFKEDEVERLIRERSSMADEGDDLDIMLDEPPLAMDEPTASSAIAGASDILAGAPKPPAAMSDLNLDDDVLDILPLGSSIQQKAPPAADKGPSAKGSGLDLGGSSILPLKEGSTKVPSGSGLSANFEDLDNLDLDLPSAAESGVKIGSSDKLPKQGSSTKIEDKLTDASKGSKSAPRVPMDLSLSDDDLLLGEVPTSDDGSKKGGSDIEIIGDDDNDLVLGGSDIGKTLADSGVKLLDLDDSGISLEQPLDVTAGGSVIDSLDSDDDEMLVMGDKPGAAQAETADEDFLLTPLEETGQDESDSGSQVIALDSDVEFAEDSAADSAESIGASGLVEDFGGGLGGDFGGGFGEAAGLGAAAGIGASMGAAPVYRPAPDSFSAASIAMLSACVILMALCGSFTYDLLRNMWSWEGPYAANHSMMDSIVSVFDKGR